MGPAPAYIPLQTRFAPLFPRKRIYDVVFDLDHCVTKINEVLVTNWSKTKGDQPIHVTPTVGHLVCQSATAISSVNQGSGSVQP